MIVDEEKERKARVQAGLLALQDSSVIDPGPSSGSSVGGGSGGQKQTPTAAAAAIEVKTTSRQPLPEEISPLETEAPRTPERDISMDSPFTPATSPSKNTVRRWSASGMADIVMQSPLSSPGRQKRGPSPTELLKEGAKGEVMLTKRPSVKRKGRSSDEGRSQELRYVDDPMVP